APTGGRLSQRARLRGRARRAAPRWRTQSRRHPRSRTSWTRASQIGAGGPHLRNVDDNRHGTIVRELEEHLCAEAPARDAGSEVAEMLDDPIDERLCDLGWRRGRKGGSTTARDIAVKGELTDH